MLSGTIHFKTLKFIFIKALLLAFLWIRKTLYNNFLQIKVKEVEEEDLNIVKHKSCSNIPKILFLANL